MFPHSEMPSASSILSVYTTFAASAMLIRTVVNELQNFCNQLIPKDLQDKITSKLGILSANLSSTICVVINETNGVSDNEVFEAAEVYLRTMINPSIKQLKVSKTPRDKTLSVTVDKGEIIVDTFDGILLQWKLTCVEAHKTTNDGLGYSNTQSLERRSFELRFSKKFQEKVINSYLPFVVERSRAIKEDSIVKRLYTYNIYSQRTDGGPWASVNLDHPSTFHTLAMDPEEVIEDLNRFVRRRDFYRRVGRKGLEKRIFALWPTWNRQIQLGNYLKFNIYDVELSSLHGNSHLQSLLISTKNRSIIVIEDIDCSIDLENRDDEGYNSSSKQEKLTLSGVLNFVDGLWSSCGDEKIFVFTTNHKERLDPALLRPGRMDMHIHMSYCTFSGFKILASNYLGIKSHCKFEDIEKLLAEVEATPAELAEELMKSEQIETAMEKVVQFLCKKRDETAGKRGEDGGDEEGMKKEVTASPRMDLPLFDGSDPMAWLALAEQYFLARYEPVCSVDTRARPGMSLHVREGIGMKYPTSDESERPGMSLLAALIYVLGQSLPHLDVWIANFTTPVANICHELELDALSELGLSPYMVSEPPLVSMCQARYESACSVDPRVRPGMSLHVREGIGMKYPTSDKSERSWRIIRLGKPPTLNLDFDVVS
ncbi:hypothetical protein ACS0TY_010569 [Phlomoides rotata]